MFLEQIWLFYDKVQSFLVTGAKFHFLEIISNATVIFLKKRYSAITPSVTNILIRNLCRWTFLSLLEINSTEIIFEIVLEQFWLFYDKVPCFLVTGAKFHFLEIISNATVIFLKKRYAAITPSMTNTLIRNLCRWTFLSLLEINSTEIIFEIVLEQFWLFYDKVMSFLVTGAKFHFLEIISNATVIFLKKRYAAITPSVTHTLIYR